MPNPGDFKALDPGLSPERRELALVVRTLVVITCAGPGGLTRERLGNQLHRGRATLYGWTRGTRIPDESALVDLYTLAALRGGGDLPSLEEMLALLRKVAAGRWRRRRAEDAAVGPVPPSAGDRRIGGTKSLTARPTADIRWPPAAELASQIEGGDISRVAVQLFHVGAQAAPSETADAVLSFRDLRLAEAAETVISHAARRDDGEVLRVLQSLLRAEACAEARALVERTVGVPDVV